MKIGLFTNAYKPIISGVVNSIELIRKGLKSLGHSVYIFAPRFPDYRDTEAGVFRFMSVNLTSGMKFPLAIPFSPRISAIINRIDLDVVHSHHPFLLGELAASIADKFHIPLVFTYHTQYEKYSHYVPLPQDLVKMVTKATVEKYLEKCDHIIFPSPTIMSEIEKYNISTPREMIPNAIDLSQFRNTDSVSVRKKYGIEEDEKILVYVGRMGQEKNLVFMMQAFKHALAECPRSRLMIVGEGPELATFRTTAQELGLGNRVIFTGRVEYGKIPEYYSASYAFVMTSTTEVKPLALLEALASGLPVIAVAAPGVSDTVTDGIDGKLTDMNEETFSNALTAILKDESCRNRLSLGALKTSERYSMKNTAHKLENLYGNLIDRGRRRKVFAGAKLNKGYIQVYTGNGKGKTTAALGMAFRASGHKMKSLIIQFMKGQTAYGEIEAVEQNPYMKIIQFGTEDFVFKGQEKDIDYSEAKAGLKRAWRAIEDSDLSLLILDEINVALHFNLLKVEDVLELLDNKPGHLEIILTGREAPREILEKADLATEMTEVKHYYNTIKLDARKGIEH